MRDQLKLAHLIYDVQKASVWLHKTNQELVLYLAVRFETEHPKLDAALCAGELYHHNGICTHIKHLDHLVGARFVWQQEEWEDGTEAGYFALIEHENVTSGEIEILALTENQIRIRWTGHADIGWNKRLGYDVPFETEFTAELQTKNIPHVFRPFVSTQMALDENTTIRLLNFEELQRALAQVGDGSGWKRMDTRGHLELVREGTPYQGYVEFAHGDRKNWTLMLEERCPVSLILKDICFNIRAKYMELMFEMQ